MRQAKKFVKELHTVTCIAFQRALSSIGDRYAVHSFNGRSFYKQLAPTEHYLLRRSLLFVVENSNEPSLRRSRPLAFLA